MNFPDIYRGGVFSCVPMVAVRVFRYMGLAAWALLLLSAHNTERAKVGVPPLEWSAELAVSSQEWADTLLSRRTFGHRANSRFGENLFSISGAAATPPMVMKAWAEEAKDYDSRTNRCRGVCGHYTQIVWRDTKRVGCAVARGGGREVWVCTYDPAGNWVGQRPY